MNVYSLCKYTTPFYSFSSFQELYAFFLELNSLVDLEAINYAPISFFLILINRIGSFYDIYTSY